MPYPQLRSMDWTASLIAEHGRGWINSGDPFFGTKSFEHDLNGYLLYVCVNYMGPHGIGQMDPLNASVTSNWLLKKLDQRKEHGRDDMESSIHEITTDGTFLYIIELSLPHQKGGFSLLKVHADLNHTVIQSQLISTGWMYEDMEALQELVWKWNLTVLQQIPAYIPGGITYNSERNTLVVLSKSGSDVYEYDTDLQFLRKYPDVLADEAIAWDSRLCCYWAASFDRIYRLDIWFREVESWPYECVSGIAVIGTELFVEQNHFVLKDTTVTVLDLSTAANDCSQPTQRRELDGTGEAVNTDQCVTKENRIGKLLGY